MSSSVNTTSQIPQEAENATTTTEVVPTSGIRSMPPRVLTYMFTFLTGKNLVAVCIVSRDLNRMVQASAILRGKMQIARNIMTDRRERAELRRIVDQAAARARNTQGAERPRRTITGNLLRG